MSKKNSIDNKISTQESEKKQKKKKVILSPEKLVPYYLRRDQ